MISNDEALRVTLSRIQRFQQQVIRLRQAETNYRLSAEGYLAEIDRMNLELRDYFSLLPCEHTHDEDRP